MPGRAQTFRLLSLLALALLLGGAIFFGLSKRMSVAGDRFVEAVAQGQLTTARTLLSESLRTGSDQSWLPDVLSESDLLDSRTARWSESSSQNGYGELRGSVTRLGGELIPVTLLFIRERLDWKLYAIRRELAGALPQLLAPPRPDHDEQITLVKRAMQDFAVSVRSHNMDYFRSTLAPSLREKYTSAFLTEQFGHFYDIPEDLTSLQAVEPLVEPPAETEAEGTFVLKGYYPTGPKQVHFVQKYCYEQTDWRLLSFGIDMR